MYLGELFRQVTYSLFLNLVYILLCSEVLLEAVDKRLLFPGVDVMPVLSQRDCLQTKHISAIESDEAGEYVSTWGVLEELVLEKQATTMDCRVVRCFFFVILISFSHSERYIAECIGIRAATLAAAGVASLLNKMNRRC